MVFRSPKLAAFDLDGTLAESKQLLSTDMGSLIARLLERMPVAVLSGGSFTQFEKQFLSGLPSTPPSSRLYIFPTNGAQGFILERGAWRKLYDNPFTEEEKINIINALHAALSEAGLDAPPAKVWGEQLEDRGSQITWSALGQSAPPDIKKQWDPTREKRFPVWQQLTKLLPEYNVGLNAATSIDVTKRGMTKAYGLEQLSKLSGVPIKDMLYVGDALQEGGNDAVVKETGVRTATVKDPEETKKLIAELLR